MRITAPDIQQDHLPTNPAKPIACAPCHGRQSAMGTRASDCAHGRISPRLFGSEQRKKDRRCVWTLRWGVNRPDSSGDLHFDTHLDSDGVVSPTYVLVPHGEVSGASGEAETSRETSATGGRGPVLSRCPTPLERLWIEVGQGILSRSVGGSGRNRRLMLAQPRLEGIKSLTPRENSVSAATRAIWRIHGASRRPGSAVRMMSEGSPQRDFGRYQSRESKWCAHVSLRGAVGGWK